MLVVPVLLIGLAVWFIASLFPRTASTTGRPLFREGTASTESALDILQKRYARGELTQSEYETMRRDLLNDTV
ncbi:MAG: SHOCT domain-containing protein [Caldilineae bacterium]|nr:MAG: SHOCT domain-containing protein [Caldilineae bacterium]